MTISMFSPEFQDRVLAILAEQTQNQNAVTRQKVAEILSAEFSGDKDSIAAGVTLVAKNHPEYTSVAGRNGGFVRAMDLITRKELAAKKAAEKATKAAEVAAALAANQPPAV